MALITRMATGLVLAVGLTAGAPAADAPARKTYHVAFSQDTLGNDWRIAQARELEEALGRHPEIRFTVTDGQGSTAKQTMDIEDLAAQKVDVLVASPRDQRAMTPVIARAYQQGIPVVLVTRKIDSDRYTAFVGPDDSAIARQVADYMAAMLKGKGRILMLQGVPTASTAIARTEAFQAQLKKYPGLRIVAVKTANYLRGDAIRAVEEVLEAGIAFDAIYSQSDSMAEGARMALKKAGLDPRKYPTVGIDYIAAAREAIRSGEQKASFTYPTCGKEVAEIVVNILRGKKVPKQVTVKSQRVTRGNVDQVKPIF